MNRKTPLRKADPPQVVLDRFEAEAGIFSLPIIVAEEGQEPYHPEMLILVAVDGPILFQEIDRPGTLEGRAGFLLRGAMKRLQYLPGTLRVAPTELAETLRPQITSRVRLVCEPTPHLSEVVAEVTAHMTKGLSYLASGASQRNVGAFFGAAARLYRAKPWAMVPSGQLIGVTIAELGVHDAALLLVTPGPEASPGWMLAEAPEDFGRLEEASEAKDRGRRAEFPPIQLFQLQKISALPSRLAQEIRQHGWDTPGDICPWTSVTGDDGEQANPSEAVFAVAMAVSLVLADLALSAGRMKKAFAGKSAPFDLVSTVEIFGDRNVEVVLSIPYATSGTPRERPKNPLLGGLYDLEGAAIDHGERRRIETELFERFSASAAGKEIGNLEWLRLILDLAAERHGLTAASLGAAEMETLLFQAIPRSIQIDPADAARVVAEFIAFFRFLRDEGGHRLAGDALEVLERRRIVADLEDAFGDTKGFGFGKRLLAAGALAGFDVQSPEGLQAWLQKINQDGLPAGIPLHPLLGDLDSLPLAARDPEAENSPAGRPPRRPRRKK